MDRISNLPDELVVKILSYLPTKVAVSTCILSKEWEFRWMWSPKLDYSDNYDVANSQLLMYRNFVDKTLPLHRAGVIESLRLRFCDHGLLYSENIKQWIGIAVVSRSLRELSICVSHFYNGLGVLLPTSLFTCKSLVILKLGYRRILVNVPPIVSLPSLKTLELRDVTYSNEDSLRLLLSHCPVLEDLIIQRNVGDYLGDLVVTVPSLKRFDMSCIGKSSYGYVIATPSLKYLKFKDCRDTYSYRNEYMPELEEADITVLQGTEKLLELITSVKRLSLRAFHNTAKESVYDDRDGVVYNQLEHLTFYIRSAGWSKLLLWLLRSSPNLRVLNLYVESYAYYHVRGDQPVRWEKKSVPECLLWSLETLEFVGYDGRPEERDLLSFILENACRLKSTSIDHHVSTQ